MDITLKIKKAGLSGRGGACYPTADKWQMVKKAKGEKKYVVCNAAEGEPGIRKDRFLLEKRFDFVLDGILLALNYLEAEKAIIYLNPLYYKEFGKKLKSSVGTLPVEIFQKQPHAGYVAGEESSALNHIEGKRIEPRLRPPFPPETGLWNYPTLVNNVETFYAVSLIDKREYEGKRFYTVGGHCVFDGVFELHEDLSIADVLRASDNYPEFPFFVQVGGDLSGEVLNSTQLKRPVGGAGSITIHSFLKHDPLGLMRYWAKSYKNESCGQCTPCREGTYRLHEELGREKPDWPRIFQILNNLQETSFCGLGCSVKTPFVSYVKNILHDNSIDFDIADKTRTCICESFT